MASEFLLELNDIEAGYGRAALVLRGLTVKVPAGTVVCLVGPNGAGKSTVLKVASGLLAPRSGQVLVDGRDVTGQGPQQLLAAGLAHVLQGHSVFREMTVAENVLLGGYTLKDKAVLNERVSFVQNLFPRGRRALEVACWCCSRRPAETGGVRAVAHHQPQGGAPRRAIHGP